MAIFDNYKLKLIALFFAIIIWFMVVTENEYEQVIEAPITLLNTPPGKVILSEVPRSAKVKIKGSGKSLIALGVSRGARLQLDLSGIETQRTFRLGPRHVILARSAGAVRSQEILMPDTVSIRLDDFDARRIAVEPRITSTPALGYTSVGDFRVTPDSVLVSGPKSLVVQIDRVYTQELEYSDLRFDVEETVQLVPTPFEKVSIARSEVDVYLDIQMLVERTMNGIPVKVKNVPRNLKITVLPSDLSLVLEGGGELLTQLDPNDILAYIDYNRIRLSPANEFPAVIDRPEGVRYRDVKPKTFKLVYERTN